MVTALAICTCVAPVLFYRFSIHTKEFPFTSLTDPAPYNSLLTSNPPSPSLQLPLKILILLPPLLPLPTPFSPLSPPSTRPYPFRIHSDCNIFVHHFSANQPYSSGASEEIAGGEQHKMCSRNYVIAFRFAEMIKMDLFRI